MLRIVRRDVPSISSSAGACVCCVDGAPVGVGVAGLDASQSAYDPGSNLERIALATGVFLVGFNGIGANS